jgi:hypothetical protein
MRNSFFIFILLMFCSCKKNTEQKNNENQLGVEPEKELIIKIGFKTSKEDVFRVMLNNIEIDKFQKKNIQIRETVPVTNDFESIVAKFGTNNISNNLIINFGNKFVKEIELNGIELSYGANSVLITNSNFKKHFNLNQFMRFDSINKKFITFKKEGRHQPSFIAKRSLINLLKKQE